MVLSQRTCEWRGSVGGADQRDVGGDGDDGSVALVRVWLEVVLLVAGSRLEHLVLESLLEASTRLEHRDGLHRLRITQSPRVKQQIIS